MKITVCLPTRGRPDKLKKSVGALMALASGNHEITYAIGIDHDDPATIDACKTMNGVTGYVMKRRGSLGSIVNTLAEKFPADVHISFADDVEMKEPGWDQHIADAVTEYPDSVMWLMAKVWIDGKIVNENPYAVVPKAWRDAAGYIFTDHFPFWHDDGWLEQVWHYARGTRQLLRIDVEITDDNAGKTHRLHDYIFWRCFYFSPRTEQKRLDEAARIAKALGWPAVEYPEQYQVPPPPMFTDWQIEHRSAGGERTPEYLQAFERAQRIYRGGDFAQQA